MKGVVLPCLNASTGHLVTTAGFGLELRDGGAHCNGEHSHCRMAVACGAGLELGIRSKDRPSSFSLRSGKQKSNKHEEHVNPSWCSCERHSHHSYPVRASDLPAHRDSTEGRLRFLHPKVLLENR